MKSALLHILFPKHALRSLLALVIALAGGLGSLAALATTVVPLSLSETVRQADVIGGHYHGPPVVVALRTGICLCILTGLPCYQERLVLISDEAMQAAQTLLQQ